MFDDLDNEQPADETLPFAIDGDNYIVDLSADNAKAFREAVEPFRRVARRLGKHKVSDSSSPARKTTRPAKSNVPEVSAEWYKTVKGEPAEVTRKRFR